ncbi:hypothetical protein Micbo1qcDRAFT_171880 [Microdochium bolleyi]|uniref:Uncharacterized protein n=1 Tax=Microdochium bolleyi TaxID=196109 RepID=A0A136JEE6_9PEZI|nr:hypothetical protein Micbo1qcDRAFT_171880 [Microdochium bolleyi]
MQARHVPLKDVAADERLRQPIGWTGGWCAGGCLVVVVGGGPLSGDFRTEDPTDRVPNYCDLRGSKAAITRPRPKKDAFLMVCVPCLPSLLREVAVWESPPTRAGEARKPLAEHLDSTSQGVLLAIPAERAG